MHIQREKEKKHTNVHKTCSWRLKSQGHGNTQAIKKVTYTVMWL